MTCNEVRNELLRRPWRDPDATSGRSPTGLPAETAAHLRGCPACSRLAARLGQVQRDLERHHAGLEPEPGFAARVVSRLPRPTEVLGWAAVRLLPATVALVLVLTGWCWLAAPSPSALLDDSPSDDLLAWVLDPEAEAR